MATKTLTASGAFATSAKETQVYKLTFSAGATLGTAQFKSGGAAGSDVGPLFNAQNDTIQVTIPNLKADYLVLANGEAIVEFFKGY